MPLFVSLNNRTGKPSYGKPLTVDGLRVVLRKLGRKAGIENQVSTHAFRRSFACFAAGAGADSRDVMGWGGWEHIEEVERYTLDYKAGPNYAAHSPADFLERIRGQIQSIED